MIAVYINNNQFRVEEDHVEEFKTGRRIKANCGDDGYVYSTILSSSYSDPYTTIIITESLLTSNLIDVLYGIVNIGDTGSLPNHLHDGLEGQGGILSYITTDILNTYSGTLQTQINSKPDTFLELQDTPSIYDSGKYAVSTTSGIIWGTAGSSNVQTFLDLTDTPTTYSGTADLFAKSTGSGIIWATASGNGYWYDGYSTPSNNLGKIDDFYINLTTNEIYKKQTSGSTIFTAKSIIIDITNNWSDGSYVGIRSVELYLSSNKVSTPLSELLGYDTSSSFDPVHAFKNEVLKTGSSLTTNGWTSDIGSITNQRIVCVFSSSITFDSMVINNYHHNGVGTTRGAKDINVYYSTDAITTAAYNGVISNSTLIFTGQLHQHVATNTVDDQVLTLINNYFLGWNIVLNTINSFYDLIDVPNTYSGTSGKFAQSTGSGIVWTTISGLDGIDGITGATGADGADGNIWLSGTGVPSSMIGSNYDFYFDEENGDIYAKDMPSTTNVLAGGTISSTTPPVTNLSNVLDGNINTYTATGAAGSYYGQANNEIKYDLGAGNEIIVTSSRHYASYASCQRYTIQGSNNNVGWTILYDRIDDNNPTGWRESGEFTNTTAYRYYRIYCTKAGNGFRLSEWQLIGATYVWDFKFNTRGPAGATASGTAFLDLIDTPLTYTGHDGEFVKVVGNTLEFSTISGISGTSDSSALFELDEYGGLMPVATISGINDVILVAPDNSKWRLIVSDTGVLSTEAF